MLAAQKYDYQVSSFLRHNGLTNLDDVRQKHIDRFRSSSNLAPHTVESYIKAVRILSGKNFGGKKLKLPYRRPQLVTLENLGKVYKHAKDTDDQWLMAFLKVAYITGLRHRDICEGVTVHDDMLECEAQKTGKLHLIPRHQILMGEIPELYANVKTVYARLLKATKAAGVPYFTPQMIRKTAANEYEKAHPGAGGVLLGHSLGSVTYRYYLDSVEVLAVAQLSLKIPDAMLPQDVKERQSMEDKQVTAAFRRLPPDERAAILKIITKAG